MVGPGEVDDDLEDEVRERALVSSLGIRGHTMSLEFPVPYIPLNDPALLWMQETLHHLSPTLAGGHGVQQVWRRAECPHI